MATTPENSPGGEEKGEEKEEQRSWNYERAKAQSYKEVVENAPAEFFTFKTTPKYENKTMCVMSLVSYLAPFVTFIALIAIHNVNVGTKITTDRWNWETYRLAIHDSFTEVSSADFNIS